MFSMMFMYLDMNFGNACFSSLKSWAFKALRMYRDMRNGMIADEVAADFHTASLSGLDFYILADYVVKAVGKASLVKREKADVRKVKMDRTPMSVGVRAPVFVTMM